MFNKMFSALFLSIISVSVLYPNILYASNDDKEFKIAQSFGFSEIESLDSIKHTFKEGGLEKLKRTLFYVNDHGSANYRISQKVDKYLIYTITNSYESFVSLPMIAILPLKGEYIQKGIFIPGEYYKVLDIIEFKKADGFPITLPLLERVMSKEQLIGYGTPPNDTDCRKRIIGAWSKGWYKNSDELYIYINVYKPNGIYEEIKYSINIDSKIWEKSLGNGTWELQDHILQFAEKHSGKWQKLSKKDNWITVQSNIEGSSSSGGCRIIQLTDNILTATQGREETYLRLKDHSLNEAKKLYNRLPN
ncbi:hypothetical protein DSCW_51070 [Desulfosarcina widdelii]|uniref:Uncharacterized protein n=1 Tax=Desulfosarcina widdelii TaxID=947919 RepID=A0A5K7ZA77_9BACT|nr:hypothetical protein [Desulfosarcina widdelii]BBO77690.1 hypothetical protein DSCW_51070 [Desulfosarcina widdelii]